MPQAPAVADLPGPIQATVVALAAEALGRMPTGQVPASLRKSAGFAPARRARLVGGQIAEALVADERFREHLATQVRAIVPDVVAALEAGVSPLPGELAHAAAVAYLVRGDDWRATVSAACDEQARTDARKRAQTDAADKLAAQLAQVRDEARQQRDKLRGQLDALKAENATLRRSLGQARVDLKSAQARIDDADSAVDEAHREADIAVREASAEARRLRTRVAELEVESLATRRASRDDRDAEVMRLRLLLDTMVETANGLRRELALPPSAGLPADLVDAVEPGEDVSYAHVGRALMSDDPILLRRLLDLPRVHLIVDGYNVSKEAWPSAPLEQQRSRLVSRLAGLVSGRGIETTVVFDGADLLHTPAVASPRTVRVRFSPPGVIADDVIRQLVAAEPSGRPVVVISTDREVAESVTKMHARTAASSALVAMLGREPGTGRG